MTATATTTTKCRNLCLVARCGDGVRRQDVEAGQPGYEACDDGNAIPTDACLNDCVAALRSVLAWFARASGLR